ncbi:hypothetical protein KDK_23720 [Dictyobacter kobayashii]|uniref:Uncharacterized protein n=1 Tax=Dictyobacter kobayashii TaxID=2014872 RepID=A0A402AHG4_9CHLR|nr:hypothetical protein KDK_23720 [Dictyobacter kobayashii]
MPEIARNFSVEKNRQKKSTTAQIIRNMANPELQKATRLWEVPSCGVSLFELSYC